MPEAEDEAEIVSDGRWSASERAQRIKRRASDLKYSDLDFDSELPQLPPAEEPTSQPQSGAEPELLPSDTTATPPPPKATTPAYQAVEPIPSALSWVLGFMALLLGLVAVGMVLSHYWEGIPMSMRVGSLVAIPAALWLVYVLGFNRGYRAPELAALLTALTWLDAVIIYQLCIQTLPLWIACSGLTLGLFLIPALRPWKMGVWSVILSGVLQFCLMGHAMVTAQSFNEWVLICASGLAMMMIWSHIGVWCALTEREGYAAYSIIGPIAQTLFLFMLIAVTVYPQDVLPQALPDHGGINEWIAAITVWIIAMIPVLPLQRYYADVSNHPTISNSFLLYWGFSMLTVPLGLLLAWYSPSLLGVPLILAYLFSMVYYGAEYRVPRFVIMGSIGIFLSVVSAPYTLGTGVLASAGILAGLAALFLLSLIWLNAFRRKLLSRKRAEAAQRDSAEANARPLRRYQPQDKMNIDLPDYDN